LLESDAPWGFAGFFFHLADALGLPRPQRPGGPPIVIGGNGPKRTLPLAAKYAREWNAVSLTPEGFAERCSILDDLLAKEGRQPGDVRRTMMTRVVPGETDAAAEAKIDDPEGRRGRGQLIGSPERIVEALGKLAEAGVQRVMAQWLDLDDMDGIELLAAKVLPRLTN
jgi:alkanesulfonate monooxygenase SsuD/methylene tetrahydromethanopterin reductase-like flavin-dependent oxidoreductase (luciferase family)